MTPAQFRLFGIVTFCLALVTSSLWNSTEGLTNARAQEAKDARLKELQTEKVATLREVVIMYSTLYGQNRVDYAQVRESNRALHDAELELCDTDQERLPVLEKILAEAKQHEERQAAARDAARANYADVLKAKADRLDAEIALLRAKAK